MRVLFLHPEDVPWKGDWAQTPWDLVVDLGFAGPAVYEDWSRRIGCRIVSLHHYAGGGQSYRWANRVLEAGRGHLLDRMGIDWWEMLAVLKYHQLHAAYLLRELRHEFDSARVDLAATRPHANLTLLTQISGLPVHCFQRPKSGPLSAFSRMVRAARHLGARQIVEIVFDKWDPGYGVRRRFAKRPQRTANEALVLLPSSYSNVTRMGLAYAAHVPHRRFLLVTTRPSGQASRLPANAASASLASYAGPPGETRQEADDLMNTWRSFIRTTLEDTAELAETRRAGVWDGLPSQMKAGLCVRNAWISVLQQEPVRAVLCGDDLNPFTRLPLLLARQTGCAAIYFDHGALDGGMLFKQPCADLHLVRGEMEMDYLLRARPMPVERVEIGAPPLKPLPASQRGESAAIVFFSQPYEVGSGRGAEIFRELLPPLLALARETGRKLIVKLHPFESEKERWQIVNAVLAPGERSGIELLKDIPVDQVIARAWCGVGVDSSVALECTLRGVPYFLCRWLDWTGLGYLEQFARFGAGIALDSAEEIETIATSVSHFSHDPQATARLWRPIDPARLDELLQGAARVCSSQCAS